MKMRNYIITTINKLILAFVAILGFSCDPDDGTVYYEYGSPMADFKAAGTVIDEITLHKLSNIEIVMDSDTVYSDENGDYQIKVSNSPSSQTYTISFKDIDGVVNGAFLPTDTIVDFSDEEFKNADGRWYSGEKTKEINIKLTSDE